MNRPAALGSCGKICEQEFFRHIMQKLTEMVQQPQGSWVPNDNGDSSVFFVCGL